MFGHCFLEFHLFRGMSLSRTNVDVATLLVLMFSVYNTITGVTLYPKKKKKKKRYDVIKVLCKTTVRSKLYPRVLSEMIEGEC